jgi:hypothetical protein
MFLISGVKLYLIQVHNVIAAILEKILLSRGETIGELFLLVKGYDRKSRGWRCGWVRWSSGPVGTPE